MSDSALTKLLASHVPKLIQKRVIQDSAPITAPLLQDLSAVVLFADISGFTALTETLGEKDPVGKERIEIPDTAQASLRPYIPASIMHRISAGQSEWLEELRKITILFINLVDPSQISSLEMAQDLIRSIQRMIYRFEGSLNKISQDDKGIMIDTAFGWPPLAHSDDPERVNHLQKAHQIFEASGYENWVAVVAK